MATDFLGALEGAIIVWAWKDAPEDLRAMSHHGGDEDWVALIPTGMEKPLWAESGTPFGVCEVSRGPCGTANYDVLIGAHA